MNNMARRFGYGRTGAEILSASPHRPKPENLEIMVAERLPELDAHASAWNDLCAASSDPVPRYSYTFVQPYLSLELTSKDKWFCLFAYLGSRLVGVMPLVISPRGSAMPVSRHLPGSPKVSLRGWTILAAQGMEREVADAFLAELPNLNLNIFRLDFPNLHEHATVMELSGRGGLMGVCREYCGSDAFLRIPDDFGSYLHSLDRTFRQNLRRWDKKLSAIGKLETEFLVGREVTDWHFEEFLRLEASGWKGQQKTAIACSPRKETFYRAWLEQLREAGWAELHLLRSGGEAVAAHFAVRVGKVMTAWKIAYHEQYRAFAPGNLLVAKLIERLCENRLVCELDALTSSSWHQQWRMSTRSYYNVYWYPKSPYNFLFGQVPMEARRLLKEAPVLRTLANVLRHRSTKDSNGNGQGASAHNGSSSRPTP